MRKTAHEPEIRPKMKIKIPNSIKKASQIQNQFEFISEIHILSKKQLLDAIPKTKTTQRRLMSKQLKRYQSDQKFRTNLKTAEHNRQQVKLDNKFQSAQRGNRYDFKIKVSGGGFRKRIKSVTSLSQKKIAEDTNRFHISQSKKRLEMNSVNLKRQQQEEDPINVLREYYSLQLQNNKQKPAQIKRVSKKSKLMIPQRISMNSLVGIIESVRESLGMQKPKEDIFEEQASFDQNHPFYEEIMLEATEWKEELEMFKDKGFSVCNNLSEFDYQSLDDPQGYIFLQKHLNQIAYCPYYQKKPEGIFGQNQYKWISLKVVGFDISQNRAIVLREGAQKYVSRMSLRFDEVSNEDYWRRIHNAKVLRNQVREAIKYIGYLDNRVESFAIEDVCSPQIPESKYEEVALQCHNRYAKQFLVYREMFEDFKKFRDLGIFKKEFKGYNPKPYCCTNNSFQKTRKILQKQHYSKFQNMGYSLRVIIKKIYEYLPNYFEFPSSPVLLEQFVDNLCSRIQEMILRFCKQTRQVLISEIIYSLRNSLGKQTKSIQKRYHKIHKYMFKDHAISVLYLNQSRYLIDYYCSFCTWTPQRPEPIITLTLSINLKQKKPKVTPQKQTALATLLKPFNIFYEEITKIHDLESDLVYTSPYFITPTSQIMPTQKIEYLIQYSYQRVQNFIDQMLYLFKYLEVSSSPNQSFSHHSITVYSSIYKQLKKDLKHILHTTLYKSGIFKVDLDPFKKTIQQSINATKLRLSKKIEKQISDEVALKSDECDEVIKLLKKIPADQKQYVEMRKYIKNDCKRFQQNIKKHYELCGAYYRKLLEQNFYQYNKKQYQTYIQSIHKQVLLAKTIDSKNNEMDELEKRFLQKINQEREEILKSIDEIKIIMDSLTSLNVYQNYRENHLKTAEVYHQLQKLNKSLQNINYRQQLLSQAESIFPLLPRLTKTLQPYFKMWQNIYKFKYEKNDWHELSIIELNYEEIKEKIQKQYKQGLSALSKFFERSKNIEAMVICETGLSEINEIEDKLWIIDSFTKEGMLKKPKMMGSVLDKVFGEDAPNNFKNMNLSDLLNKGILKSKQFVINTANRAQKIWNLQKKLQEIVNSVKELHFEIKQKLGVLFVPKELLLDLTSLVKENIVHIDVLKCEEQADELKKKINSSYLKLKIIEETLETIKEFEDQFFKLFRVFKIDQIASQLPEDKKKMTEVLKIWLNIVKHFQKDLQLWEAIDSESYRNRTQKNIITLKQIFQSLKNLLNKKRLIFSRLFFVSDEELIEMIVDENYTLPCHRLKRLFSINGIIEGSKGIEALQGNGFPQRQKLMLRRPVGFSMLIWDKLKVLKEEMVEKIKFQCASLDRTQILSLILLKQLKEWTVLVTDGLRKNRLKQLLQQYIERMSQNLCKDLFNYGNIVGLRSVLRDRIRELIEKGAQGISSFQWQKMVKVQEKRNQQTNENHIFIKTLSYSLQCNYEYVGSDFSSFITLIAINTPSLHKMMALRNTMNMCGAICGRKGQEETVRAIAQISLSHFVSIQFYAENNSIEILELLKGFYLQNLWGMLSIEKTMQLFQQEVFGLISKVANQIRKVVSSQNGEFYSQNFKIPIEYTSNQLNINLYLLLPQNCQLQKFGGPTIMTLRNVYRDISIKTPNWSPYWKYYLSMFNFSEEQGIQITQNLKLNPNFSQYSENLLIRILSNSCSEAIGTILNQTDKMDQFLEILHKNINSRIPEEICSWVNEEGFAYNYDIEKNDFRSLVGKLFSDQYNGSKCLLVYGEPESGKTHLILQTMKSYGLKENGDRKRFARVNSLGQIVSELELKNPRAIIFEILNKSSYQHPNFPNIIDQIQETWAQNSLDLQTFVIVETQRLDSVGPSLPSNGIPLFYKKNNIRWQAVFKLQLEKLNQFDEIKQELQRQLPIVFSHVIAQFPNIKTDDKILKAISQQAVKMTRGLSINRKVEERQPRDIIELILMVCLWSCQVCLQETISKSLNYLKLCEEVGSIFLKQKAGKNVFDYFYEPQKDAWIQWSIVDMPQYFKDQFTTFSQIYVPLKETTSAVYFCDSLIKLYDISIICEQEIRGMGTTKLAKKIASIGREGKSFYYSLHGSWSGKVLQKMIKHQYPSRKLDGAYSPYRNSEYTVVLDDLNMANQSCNLQKQIYSLLKYRCEYFSSKKINQTQFIVCSNRKMHRKILKETAGVWMRPLCEQSMRSIFEYIFDWFFGNTENPFSKNVRSISQSLIQKALQIYNYGREIANQKSSRFQIIKYYHNFSTLAQVFHFICNITPKSIKESEQMEAAWEYELSQVYNQIHPPIKLSQPKQILCKIREKDYALISQKETEEIITKILSQQYPNKYPLIYYHQFVENVIKGTRLFLSHNASITGTNNILKIGRKKVGKKTVLKCCLLVCTGKVQMGLVSEESARGWRKDIYQELGRISKAWQSNEAQSSQELLVFNLNPRNSHEYLEVLVEFLTQRESLNLLYQSIEVSQKEFQEQVKSVTLLSELQIPSHQTKKYAKFLNLCRKNIRIGVLASGFSSINDIHETVIKNSSIIQVEIEPTPVQAYQSIAQASLKIVYSGILPYFDELQIKNINISIQENSKNFETFEHPNSLLSEFSKMKSSILSAHHEVSLFEKKMDRQNGYNSKQKLLVWMRKSVNYYVSTTLLKIEEIKRMQLLLDQREKIEKHKRALQLQLAVLRPKLARISDKNSVLQKIVKTHWDDYSQKKKDYDDQKALCDEQRNKTKQMEQQCENQLNSVTPILQSAEKSLQKVTRDDINQLRSFPNPPLPAARVVEALCFVFSEDHLVKEKVLETGEKVKDYWDYAKKFILNDRLLKRVEQFKPEFIKTLNKKTMQELKKITQKPQFNEDRVFKASSAAGNLSIWMRAIVETFAVMEIIEPKRKLLREALEILEVEEEKLEVLRKIMENSYEQYSKKKFHYDEEMAKQKEIQDKIIWLQQKLSRGERFLVMLGVMQGKWKSRIFEIISNEMKEVREQALALGFLRVELANRNYNERYQLISRITDIQSMPFLTKMDFAENLIVSGYHSYSFQNHLPISQYFTQNLVALIEELKEKEEELNIAQHPSKQSINNSKIILLDETQIIPTLLLNSIQTTPIKLSILFRVVDCEDKTAQQIFQLLIGSNQDNDEVQEQVSQRTKPLYFILENLEHNQQALKMIFRPETTNHSSKYYKLSSVPMLICITDPAQLPYLCLRYEDFQSVFVFNQNHKSTIESVAQQILTSLNQNSETQRNSLRKIMEHRQQVANRWGKLCSILQKTENILLNDANISEWISCFNQYGVLHDKDLKASKGSKFIHEIFRKISENRCWRQKRRISHYVNQIRNILNEKGRQGLGSLNQTLTQVFSDLENKYPIFIISQNNPINPVGIKKTPNLWKYWLSTNSNLIYVPNISEIQVYIQNQKEILLVVENKLKAKFAQTQIIQKYEAQMEKMEAEDDLFDRKNHLFKAYILIIPNFIQEKTYQTYQIAKQIEGPLKITEQRTNISIKSNNLQIKSDSQLLTEQFNNKTNATKVEILYISKLLSEENDSQL